jgi:O-antigen/teichoic acid export membrane protein
MNTTPAPGLRPALYEGAFWLLLGSGGQKLLGLAAGIVLARLLRPHDFGVFAFAALAYELASLFDGVGTAQYVVAAREADTHLDVAHRINFTVAVVLALILGALSPVAAAFFHEPRLMLLIPVLALAIPLGALGAVQGALLEREMRLGALARRRMVVNLGTVVLTVAFAAAGLGVWALILPVPLRSAGNAWMNLSLHRWRPRWRGRTPGGRAVLGYGRHVLGAKLARYLTHQLDNGVVGRVLGASALGIYDFAYGAAMMPPRVASDFAGQLAFPAFATQARGRAAIADAPHDPGPFVTMTRWTTFLAGPLVLGLVVVASDWVRVLYGPKWLATIPLIRILAPAGFAVLMARPVASWMLASRHEAWPARIQFASLPAIALALWLTVPHGVTWVALGMGAVLVLQSAAMIAVALRARAAEASAYAHAVWSGLLPSLIMVLVLAPAMRLARDAGTPLLRLAIFIPGGVALFVASSAWLARPQLREILDLLKHGLRRRARTAA